MHRLDLYRQSSGRNSRQRSSRCLPNPLPLAHARSSYGKTAYRFLRRTVLTLQHEMSQGARRCAKPLKNPSMEQTMKSNLLCLAVLGLVMSGAANAKGCLEGAAVGGVAGHVAGKHAVLGAAGGCAVGSHEANKKEKEKKASAAQAAPDSSPNATPSTAAPKK